MSTDLQQHSIDNQSEAIALYAVQRGLTIVRSYEDSGRSGLGLDGRAALRNLLDDVRSGRADFRTILVYDVSRWGRFQDSDESAHYEYLCRQAGVGVEYCAEQFENDGSLTTTLLKNIKRVMAGEFSRELSTKVFAGQSRLAANGFHTGGAAGYGLRRMLLDEQGNQKMELVFGQRKSLQTERVILVPGPIAEINTVQQVYDLFIDQKASLNEIARILNAQGVPNEFGRAWRSTAVRRLLSSERYIGNAVYNRTSKKLSKNWRRNPREEWIRGLGAFKPIVTLQQFQQAGDQLAKNSYRRTRNEMLDALTALWCCEGRLSRDVIDASTHTPSSRAYIERFGGLSHAYHLVRYVGRDFIRKNLILRGAILKDIVEQVAKLGGYTRVMPRKCQILVNGEVTVSVLVSRPAPSSVPARWRFGHLSRRKPDLLVVARLDKNDSIKDYLILPFIFLPYGSWVTLTEVSKRLDGFRSADLTPFYRLCARRSFGQD